MSNIIKSTPRKGGDYLGKVKELEYRLNILEMRLAMIEQAEKKKQTKREWLALLPTLIRSIFDSLTK